MAMLVQSYYIYRRNLRAWFGQPMNVIAPLFFAAFFFFLFGAPLERITQMPGFPADNYLAFIAPMVLVQAVVFSGSDAGLAMITDILSGYLDKLLLAPINRFAILLGSLLMAGTRALFQALIVIALALLLGVDFKGGPHGILVIALFSVLFGVAWSCIGLVIALRTKSAQATQSSFIFFFPFPFLTTAFMPRELLPDWFQVAVALNPVNYVLESVRAITIQGWVWHEVLPGVWVLTVMTVALTAVATWFYRRATV